MGSWHAHALVRAGGTLKAIADTVPFRGSLLAKKYGAHAYNSVEELLSNEKLDAVHICTPPNSHFELAEHALAAGVHVLVEKPLAPNLSSTKHLVDLARDSKRLLIPVHQLSFQRGVRRIIAEISKIQPLMHIDYTVATAGGDEKDDKTRDELVQEILPHALALFYHLSPDHLETIGWDVTHPASGELHALGRTRSISLAINLSTRARPTRHLLTVLGKRGSFQSDLFHGFSVFQNGPVSRTRKLTQPFSDSAQTLIAATWNLMLRAAQNEPAYPGLRDLIRAFYQSIRLGTPPPTSPEEILSEARVRSELISLFHQVPNG